ncbi:MAG: hypothetical protein HC854_18230 [Flavobacterium sp.]|nr:hypothetical protein [Flavobacterium sp.]
MEIKLKDKTLQIIFSDNGKGFDLETLKRKNGLLNMQKRALKIKGQLLIESNNGTQIKFIGKKLI